MKEKVISIQQIKEAKRLYRALEITSINSPTLTFDEMLDRVVEMDRCIGVVSSFIL
jgi:hypothetical protein